MIDALRSFLLIRNPHVREVVAAYHQCRRPVPMPPEELAAAAKRRGQRAVAEAGGVRLSFPVTDASEPEPEEIRNPLTVPVYLCPTSGCRSNRKSGVLAAREWAGGDRNHKDKPPCMWCGKTKVWVEGGGVLETENATPEGATQ